MIGTLLTAAAGDFYTAVSGHEGSVFQISLTGILAVMHCSQYLWITNYYARREATAAVATWRWQPYFGILILGGVAVAVGAWFLAHRHGRLHGQLAASTQHLRLPWNS